MKNMDLTGKYHHKVRFLWKHDIFVWFLRSFWSLRFIVWVPLKHHFCENRFLGEITISGFCDFSEYRLIRHPEHTGSIHKHPDFQNQSPSVSPDPFPVKNQSDVLFVFFHSVLYYFHIWNPWNLKLSISASCKVCMSRRHVYACHLTVHNLWRRLSVAFTTAGWTPHNSGWRQDTVDGIN